MFFSKSIDRETLNVEIVYEEEAIVSSERQEKKTSKKHFQKKLQRNQSISDFLTGFKKSSVSKTSEFTDSENYDRGRSFYKNSERKMKTESFEKKISEKKERIIENEKEKTIWKKGSKKREIVFDPPLHFPSSVKNIGVSAKIKVKAFVDPDGRVFGIEFLEKSGFSQLDLSVARHLRSMKFGKILTNENSEFSREYIFRLKANSE